MFKINLLLKISYFEIKKKMHFLNFDFEYFEVLKITRWAHINRLHLAKGVNNHIF